MADTLLLLDADAAALATPTTRLLRTLVTQTELCTALLLFLDLVLAWFACLPTRLLKQETLSKAWECTQSAPASTAAPASLAPLSTKPNFTSNKDPVLLEQRRLKGANSTSP